MLYKNVTQLFYVCLNNIEGFCVRKELLLLCVEAGAKGLLILISLLTVVAGLAPTGCKTENILGEAYLIFLTTLEQCRTGNGSCLCRCMTEGSCRIAMRRYGNKCRPRTALTGTVGEKRLTAPDRWWYDANYLKNAKLITFFLLSLQAVYFYN